MPSKTVLLTGATGFVGSHTAEAFAAGGARLRALVRGTSDVARLQALGADLFEGGLHDDAVVREAAAGADVVVHMAAATRARTAAEYHAVNEAGTRSLLAALAGVDAGPRRFVYLSSLAAAGPSGGEPVTAETEPRPLTAYGRSKLGGERACAALDGAIETVIVRAPAVYGPGDRDLLRFFRMARRGVLPVPGGPARPLQLVHVQDLAAALVRAANLQGVRGVYHFAEPRAYAWREVVGLVAEAVGVKARLIPVPQPALRTAAVLSEFGAGLTGRATIFNREKAEELLAPGWLCEAGPALEDLGITPRPLAIGLRQTADWYREHGWL